MKTYMHLLLRISLLTGFFNIQIRADRSLDKVVTLKAVSLHSAGNKQSKKKNKCKEAVSLIEEVCEQVNRIKKRFDDSDKEFFQTAHAFLVFAYKKQLVKLEQRIHVILNTYRACINAEQKKLLEQKHRICKEIKSEIDRLCAEQ